MCIRDSYIPIHLVHYYYMDMFSYFLVSGLGGIWLGSQIIWVVGFPRQLKSHKIERTEKNSQETFMLFWLDQYSWIGLTLLSFGIVFFFIGTVY